MRILSIIGWILAAIAFFVVLTIPLSNDAQIATVVLSILLAAFLKLFRPKGALRMITLGIATSVIIRYIWWRSTETIPPVEDILSFVPGVLLFAAELYAVFMLVLSIFVVAKPIESRDTPKFEDGEAPTVDVYVPSYNESTRILSRTLMAASLMDYPKNKLNVYLLDDGATQEKLNSSDAAAAKDALKRQKEMQALCQTLGVHYQSREDNKGAKAGNLNSALKNTQGELVVVFDADHVPTADFLQETVGHFIEDENLFLVQTPHFFLNPDPVERNLGLHGKVPSETEMFYGTIQKGLDSWNGSFFCGSAAVMRRKALEEVDGFAGTSITEDCETAVELHANGWNSRYIDKKMITGLQPDTFASFIGQRSRWAQGMLQILLLDRPQFKSGLSLAQRLCYSSSIMFWLFPFARLTFVFAPLFFLFFDLRIFTASGQDFLAYTIAYMAANLIIQNLLFGPVRRPWMSEVYEYAQSFHLGRAALAALINPTKPKFNVTAKDEVADKHRVSELAGVFYVVFYLLLAAQVWTIYRLFTEPENFWLLMVVGGWNTLNLLLAGISLGIVNERPSASIATNTQTKAWIVSGVTSNGEVLPLQEPLRTNILNVGQNGFLFTTPEGLVLEKNSILHITLEDPTQNPISTFSVQTGPKSHVLRKLHPESDTLYATYQDDSAQTIEARTLLLHQNTQQWYAYDPKKKSTQGVISGTLFFFKLGIEQTFRGLFGDNAKNKGTSS